MCRLFLDGGDLSGFTSVSNTFIDNYMPLVNGDFTKIYLYLLRIMSAPGASSREEITTEKIAEKFNLLESDINKALRYWEQQGLLTLSSSGGQIREIKLNPVIRNCYVSAPGIAESTAEAAGYANSSTNLQASLGGYSTAVGKAFNEKTSENTSFISGGTSRHSGRNISKFKQPQKNDWDTESVNKAASGREYDFLSDSSKPVPEMTNILPGDMAKYESDKQLTFLKCVAETYMNRPVSYEGLSVIVYMLNDLNFSSDFIEYILEMNCESLSFSRIKDAAVTYYRHGITDRINARKFDSLESKFIREIYKALEIHCESPTNKDKEYVRTWMFDYSFPDDIIIDACERTTRYTNKGSSHNTKFSYADRILTNWYKKNVKSTEDIKKLDEAHQEKQEKTKKSSGSLTYSKKTAGSAARKKTFTEREYDADDLEQKLRASTRRQIADLLSGEK